MPPSPAAPAPFMRRALPPDPRPPSNLRPPAVLDEFMEQNTRTGTGRVVEQKRQLVSAADWFAQQEAAEKAERERREAEWEEGDEEDELAAPVPLAAGAGAGAGEGSSELTEEDLNRGTLVRLNQKRRDQEAAEVAARAHLRTKALAERLGAVEDEELTDKEMARAMQQGYMKPREVSKWDCETVLSLRSNLDNHPGTICDNAGGGGPGRITLSSKSGMPVGFVGLGRGQRGDLGAIAEGDGAPDSDEEMDEAEWDGEDGDGNLGATRGRGAHKETKEERKARKAAVKEAKRQARERKKGTKQEFKDAEKDIAKREASAGHGVSAMRL